jgi:hypothetical protein
MKKIYVVILLVAALPGGMAALLYSHTIISFADSLRGCSDFSASKNMNDDEKREFSRLSALCTQKEMNALNRAISLTSNEIAFSCIPQKNNFSESEPAKAIIRIRNRSNRRLILLDERMERLTTSSYKSQGYLQDDYSLQTAYPVRSLSIIEPLGTLNIPVSFKVEGIGLHQINLAFSTPVWESLKGNISQVKQATLARAFCQFEIGT